MASDGSLQRLLDIAVIKGARWLLSSLIMVILVASMIAGDHLFVNNVGLISHFGVSRGFRSVFGLPLNAGKGLAVMTNGDNGELIHKALVERALAHE